MPRTEQIPLDGDLKVVLQAVSQVLPKGIGVVVVLLNEQSISAGGNLPPELMAHALRNAAQEIGQGTGELIAISLSDSKGD